jgi:hypothetical protein
MSVSADEPELNCPECGTPIRRAGELARQCFVCLFESALEEEEVPRATSKRFDHYQVITDADGTPVELGRGAMGITYKAFDVDLRCPVTLKVIRENISVTNRRGFVFCAKPVRRQASVTRMLPRSSTSGEPARTTFTLWSLSRAKRSRI